MKWANKPVSAEDFLRALKEDEVVDLANCEIVGDVDIEQAGIPPDAECRYTIRPKVECRRCTFQDSVSFVRATFGAPVSFWSATFVRTADFRSAIFGEEANFSKATFKGEASFAGATFSGRGTSFWGTIFGGKDNFEEATFSRQVVFNTATFSGVANFMEATFSGGAHFSGAAFERPANFAGVRYWPDTLGLCWRKLLWCAHWCFKWKCLPKGWPAGEKPRKGTQFHLDSQNIDEVSNPFFKRHVADQQFYRAFRAKHKFWGLVWRGMSDYGRSLWLWATWSLGFAALFAIIYAVFFPTSFVFTDVWLGSAPSGWDFFYYSVVTFTTLGFGDIVASHPLARAVVTAEVIVGYTMLGGLISIFANKLARRS